MTRGMTPAGRCRVNIAEEALLATNVDQLNGELVIYLT